MPEVMTQKAAPPPATAGTGRLQALQPIDIPSPSRAPAADGQIFSPVNEAGCFEFDRVIKSGQVLKRTRKTKAWKPIYIVLRPNILSIYKDDRESKLRHQLNLSDLTAVARQRDSKSRVDHVFGLFSPSRNFHLSARTDEDAQAWVEAIRREARCEMEDAEMSKSSPTATRNIIMSKTEAPRGTNEGATGAGMGTARREIVSSSSEPERRRSGSLAMEGRKGGQTLVRQPSHSLFYSGNEQGSMSDFSDTFIGVRDSTLSFSHQNDIHSSAHHPTESNPANATQSTRQGDAQNAVYGSSPYIQSGHRLGDLQSEEERTIRQGWLYLLKSKGGMRQWKKVWVVLRPKTLGLYKNEEEYSAHLIVPFTSVLNAVEIDHISRSKKYCMQLIAEERNYRFCAPDEEALSRWLGTFKSMLAKRKESELQRSQAHAQAQLPTQTQAPSQGRVRSRATSAADRMDAHIGGGVQKPAIDRHGQAQAGAPATALGSSPPGPLRSP